jgi:hypothetical protein
MASVGLVFISAFGSRGEGWNDILEFLPFLVGGIATVLAGVAVYSWYAEARDKRLALDDPTAVVFGSEMTSALKKHLRANPNRYTSPDLVGRAPHLFTVVATVKGISLWSGSARNLVRFWEIEWQLVSALRPATLRLDYKNVRGLLIETNAPDAVGALEIAPCPEGPFSISYSEARLTSLIESLDVLWHASLQARRNN